MAFTSEMPYFSTLMEDLEIKIASPKQFPEIREIVRIAFGQPAEARLVDMIRNSDNYLPAMDLVAEKDGQVAGHIMLSKIGLQCEDGIIDVLGVAPLSVNPAFQKIGLGRRLMEESLRVARRTSFPAVFVLGEPDFYNRFGFEPSSKWEIRSPYPVGEDFFMALELQEDSLLGLGGIIQYPDYFKEV